MEQMNVTILGAGNSGLAMAAHLSQNGNTVTLWNRSKKTIEKLLLTKNVVTTGVLNDHISIANITNDIEEALTEQDIILITTPANSHQELAMLIAQHLRKEVPIVLNPGRTFGAIDFLNTFNKHNGRVLPIVAETQTIIYTCRKTAEDSVHIISLKSDILISATDPSQNEEIIKALPLCIRSRFKPAKSMIETSIGNVGMILHCAPLLLNTGWTESETNSYKYYYDGISPSIGRFVEKIDSERVSVARKLGVEIESTVEWLRRIYKVRGNSLYECVQTNEAYKTIDAPLSLDHRYIFEDVPYGLVPLEAIGHALGLDMKWTTLTIDLANGLLDTNFRKSGRNLESVFTGKDFLNQLI